jgi:D-3-phosphoglycerate dehydrogenase
MPKVLIADKMSELALETFQTWGLGVDYEPGLSAEDLCDRIDGYDGLAVRSATQVTADLLDAAQSLKIVGRAGIGVDNIDVAAATQRGIVVMNTPGGNAITTAEHALALLLSLARKIPAANSSTQSGKWEKSRFMGTELTGKILGVVGCGNIGAIVADRALGLRMHVIAYDPYLSPERAEGLGVEKVDLDTLLKRADAITLHVPLTETSRRRWNPGTWPARPSTSSARSRRSRTPCSARRSWWPRPTSAPRPARPRTRWRSRLPSRCRSIS